MEVLGLILIVLFFVLCAILMFADTWFRSGRGPLPWIAQRFGFKLEGKEHPLFWSRLFRRR